MKQSIFFLLILLLLLRSSLFGIPAYTLSNANPPGINTSDPDYIDGYLNVVTQYNAVPNDSNAGAANRLNIQQALDDGYNYGRAIYFPPGTFYVDNSLDCYARLADFDKADKTKAFILVGSKYGNSVIRLKNNQNNFQTATANGCNAVVNIWSEATYSTTNVDPVHKGRGALCYNHSIRHLTIDTGSNNPGAVGIRFASAQGCSIQATTVNAYNSFAGVYNLPGRAGGIFDSTINGGDYGIYLPFDGDTESGAKDTISGPIINGVTFNDQTINAIYLKSDSQLLLVGFKIYNSVSTSPVIWIRRSNTLDLIDGSIEYVNSTALKAIDNSVQGIYMKNVYVKGATRIVQNTGANYLSPDASSWTFVKEYLHAESGSEQYVDGLLSAQTIVDEINPVSASVVQVAVDGFFSDHIWDTLPSREDAGVITLFPSGGNDYNQINNALTSAAGAKVFLTRGIYRVSNTVTLGKDDVLMGVSRVHSIIRPHNSWTDVAQKAIVQTSSNAQSKAVLTSLAVQNDQGNHPKTTYLKWRAGENSMAHDVWVVGVGSNTKKDIKHFRNIIEGNGGGRWSTLSGAMTGMRAKHPDTATFLIQNTSEPLRMYGMNSEHIAYSKNGQIRIDNSSNVEIYMYKFEAGAPGLPEFTDTVGTNHANYAPTGSPDIGRRLDWQAIPIRILGGSNISIHTLRGHAGGFDQSLPLIHLVEVENFTATSITQYGSGGIGKRLTEEYPAGTVVVDTVTDVAIIQRTVVANTAPSVSPISDVMMNEGEMLQVNIAASDSESHSIILLATGLPAWASLTDNGDGTGVIEFTPDFSSGTNVYNISVSAEDTFGEESAAELFALTVNDSPNGPVVYSNGFSTGNVSDDFLGNTDSFYIGANQLFSSECDAWKSISLNSNYFPPNTDNFKIVTKMRSTGNSWASGGIRFRELDSTHWYELGFRSDAGSDIRIVEKSGPAAVNTIDAWNIGHDTTAVTNVYSLIVSGTNVSVYWGNQFVGMTVVTGNSGNIGLSQRSGDVWCDYFRVISNTEADYTEDFDDSTAPFWNYDESKFQIIDIGAGDLVLKQSSGTYNFASYNDVISVDANFRVSVKGRAVGTRVNNFDSPILAVKFIDLDNWITVYVLENVNTGIKDIVLKKKMGSIVSTDTLATGVTSLASVTDWHTLEARVDGDKLSVWINGTLEVLEAIEPDLTAPVFGFTTECGIRTGAASVSVEYNDFAFYDEYNQ